LVFFRSEDDLRNDRVVARIISTDHANLAYNISALSLSATCDATFYKFHDSAHRVRANFSDSERVNGQRYGGTSARQVDLKDFNVIDSSPQAETPRRGVIRGINPKPASAQFRRTSFSRET